MEYLETYASEHRHFSFRTLLESQASRTEIVVTFLAILELMKTGKIVITQEHIFDDIQIDSQIAA
jgi:segregation and condensation protein A